GHHATVQATATWNAQRLAHDHVSKARLGSRPHCWMVLSRCSHSCIGVSNPVLTRSTTLAGSGARGLLASSRLDRNACLVVTDARRLSNRKSTRGTRTSREWAMLAQSVSRNSWLRI